MINRFLDIIDSILTTSCYLWLNSLIHNTSFSMKTYFRLCFQLTSNFKIMHLIRLFFVLSAILFLGKPAACQNNYIDNYNVKWTSQSENASASMPCGGGDIGLNVWVEKGEVLFYISRSGAFDENNVFPKFGRIRIKVSPNPFDGGVFSQELKLRDGYVLIEGKKNGLDVKLKIWVDVFTPVVHVSSESNRPIKITSVFESWRTQNLQWTNPAQTWASLGFRDAPFKATIYADTIRQAQNSILFYHQNRDSTLFDATVKQQGLDSIKNKLWNPLKNLTFGGKIVGENLKFTGNTFGRYANTDFKGWKLESVKASKNHEIKILLHIQQTGSIDDWEKELDAIEKRSSLNTTSDFLATVKWWNNFWNRSFIHINSGKADTSSVEWKLARNYQLFRYQLGCNAYGKYPTKFNGGLFTVDPSFTDKNLPFTPDHRNWGGGTFTAQNQRLVYYPMFKSGDFDMLPSQLNFYLQALNNAELRTQFYWGHKGASFTEQLEQFGLPLATSYGWNRPLNFQKGLEYNYWLEYLWDTQLEFCFMMLDLQKYTAQDISQYIPFVESCLTFFEAHYEWEALSRGRQALDGEGKLILYPGSGAETYKMAYNSTSTIAGLKAVLTKLIELPESYLTSEKRAHWIKMLEKIPAISFREKNGFKTIAPAWTWARINNQEIPQLYPVFPFGLYGVGLPDLDIAVNTWKYGTDVPIQKNYISWHQDAIFCARLGLTDEAAQITMKKLADANRRFPTFWGPGHDWVPDHNWGGSGMVGLQEMLMQTVDKAIYLFPAWPKAWDVDFKLHAPYNTVVEGVLKDGKIQSINVTPASRMQDLKIMLK